MDARIEAIVMGASAGAIEALSAILPALPRDYPQPIMIVVHLPIDKKSVIPELFSQKCEMNVREADDKCPIEPGTIYFAPADYHMLVEEEKVISLSTEEAVNYSRPSIDVLFETAADVYGPALLAIVLTGASNDGARGLAQIVAAGGQALVQNPVRAYATEMPLAAINTCPEAAILEPEQIREHLLKLNSKP